VRRLLGAEHRDSEFATTWREYDLDPKTRALLEYAEKLTLEPSAIEDLDIDALTAAGWDDAGIRELTRLIAFYNFTGRLEAASGLPRDEPDARGIDRFIGRADRAR
jgi:alkylhydroperoxidase family enzyme